MQIIRCSFVTKYPYHRGACVDCSISRNETADYSPQELDSKRWIESAYKYWGNIASGPGRYQAFRRPSVGMISPDSLSKRPINFRFARDCFLSLSQKETDSYA